MALYVNVKMVCQSILLLAPIRTEYLKRNGTCYIIRKKAVIKTSSENNQSYLKQKINKPFLGVKALRFEQLNYSKKRTITSKVVCSTYGNLLKNNAPVETFS